MEEYKMNGIPCWDWARSDGGWWGWKDIMKIWAQTGPVILSSVGRLYVPYLA